jgi:hypothetical protein
MNRKLSYLAILGTLYAAFVHADDFKPDFHLIEYQFFVPSQWFQGREGPETVTSATIQSEAGWKALWAKLEPRLSRDMRQRVPHPFVPVNFTQKTLLVVTTGANPDHVYSLAIEDVMESATDITVNLIDVIPRKKCGDQLINVIQIVHFPVALILIPKTTKPVHFQASQVEKTCDESSS